MNLCHNATWYEIGIFLTITTLFFFASIWNFWRADMKADEAYRWYLKSLENVKPPLMFESVCSSCGEKV